MEEIFPKEKKDLDLLVKSMAKWVFKNQNMQEANELQICISQILKSDDQSEDAGNLGKNSNNLILSIKHMLNEVQKESFDLIEKFMQLSLMEIM